MSDDELFAILSEIADEEIMAKSRASIIEVGRRIISLAANGAEPVQWQVRYVGDARQPGFWKDSTNYAYAKEAYENCPNHTDGNGWQYRPLYADPVSTGPRYDWSVSGMKQSETGNWVMAGNKPGE